MNRSSFPSLEKSVLKSYTLKYAFFKVRQIRLTKVRRIWKYKYVLPKYTSPKVKYAYIEKFSLNQLRLVYYV